jgi:hypothetical protein
MALDVTLSASPSTVNRGDPIDVVLQVDNPGGTDVVVERVVVSGSWLPTVDLSGLGIVVPAAGGVTFRRQFAAQTQQPAASPRPPLDTEGISVSAIVWAEGLANVPVAASCTVVL